MFTLCYIDPGTGSMLFTIFIGIVTSLMFLWKKLVLKLKFLVQGGRAQVSEERYPYVIFSDSKRYWNVFKPICDEFEKRGISLEYMTASPDDPALQADYQHVHCQFIGEGNVAYAKLNLLDAGIVLSTTPGLDVYQWKRSRNVKWYVHTFHAVDEGTGYRMFGMDYYDAVLLTGAFQERYIRMLEEMRGLPAKELLVAGSTYMDALKDKLDACQFHREEQSGAENSAEQLKGIFEEALPEKNKRKTILLAPSWGESSILSKYGAKILRALLDTGYEIIVRPHPQSLTSEKAVLEPLWKEFPDSDDLTWNYDNDNFEVLRKADLMITDFSGIIFDYALVFGKPIIYADTSFDSAPYDAAWIEEPLWRFEVLKELGAPLKETDLPRMGELMDTLLHSTQGSEARARVRQEAWQCIGESAERTVDYMVRKYQELCAERV